VGCGDSVGCCCGRGGFWETRCLICVSGSCCIGVVLSFAAGMSVIFVEVVGFVRGVGSCGSVVGFVVLWCVVEISFGGMAHLVGCAPRSCRVEVACAFS
jgi:hypothetical protein